MEETCSICLNLIGNSNDVHTLDCGHTFHTRCILNWFRSSNVSGSPCPLCRCSGSESSNLCLFDIHTRATYLRRRSRSKNIPKKLKKLILNVRNREEMLRSKKQALRAFKSKNKESIKEYFKLRRSVWGADVSVRRAKSTLGLYNDADYKIPLLNNTCRRRGSV